MRLPAFLLLTLLLANVGNVQAQFARVPDADSLALVDLYKNNGGTSWNYSANWLETGKWVSQWEGVNTTLVSENLRRVTFLYLANNNLDGVIPGSIGNLDALEWLVVGGNNLLDPLPESLSQLPNLARLDLFSNGFSELPDLTGLPLTHLSLQGNRFTFDDLEPYASLVTALGPNFIFAPQDSAKLDLELQPDGSILLKSNAGGTGTTYNWYQNDGYIVGESGPTYLVSPSELTGDSKFYYWAMNSAFSGLILKSKVVFIQPVDYRIVVNSEKDTALPAPPPADNRCDVDPIAAGDQCTLRAAIQIANSLNAMTITFEGVGLIQPATPLPTISQSVTIDGDVNGTRVEVRGGSAGPGNGLDIQAQNVTLRNISINAFDGWGIRINGGSGHVVQNARIGALPGGLPGGMSNTAGGILVEGSAQNITIGGLEAQEENVIGRGIRIDGAGTEGIRVLRNAIELPQAWVDVRPLRVPIDLKGDGPTCAPWTGTTPTVPNRGVPPPRISNLHPGSVEGFARPGATVIAYLVTQTGSSMGRYWPRAVEAIGASPADGAGKFKVDFDYTLSAESLVSVSMVDASGNTSELSQIKRPVIYIPGVGGSWIEAGNGDNLFVPVSSRDYVINHLLSRLAMDATGENSLNGEEVHPDGILEEPGFPYRAVLKKLQAAGFVGNAANSGEGTLDLWRFWYDWRRDPTQIADLLRDLTERVTSNTTAVNVAASCEVDIVTHSNGGMVASAYVWKYRDHSRDRVNRLLMSAAPYLGAAQVAAAHTRGYIFDIEQNLYADFEWGNLVSVFQNLPDGYGLLPSRTYMDLINPDAPQQSDWYLTDLSGMPLHGYDDTFEFMTALKIDAATQQPLGLARNGTMWAQQQNDLHGLVDDWRLYDGPPQVFRHIGRKKLSTAVAWRATPLILAATEFAGSARRETGDTDRHVTYREALMPRMGWGDGTVPLVSATVGGGVTENNTPIGLSDYSGSGRPWIKPFEYYPCLHLDMVATKCESEGTFALDRTVTILHSGYAVSIPPPGKASDSSVADDLESEVLYIDSDAPISVSVEDGAGARTGPVEGQALNAIQYEVPDIGYWASLGGAVLSLPSSVAYTVQIEAVSGDAVVRVSRAQSVGDQVRNILFEDQALEGGGSLRFTYSSVGTSPAANFDLDEDGNGVFEGILQPGVEILGTDAGPSIPDPAPYAIQADISVGSADPVVSIAIPDVGGAVWNWTLENIPNWVLPSAGSGQNPATVAVTLTASTLLPGLHRDTMQVALSYDGFTTRTRIPIELAIRDQAGSLSAIRIQPANASIAVGDSLQFWALGEDQLGLPFAVDALWSATGGQISDAGVFIAGFSPGYYTVTAANASGSIMGDVQVEILSAVGTEQSGELPTTLVLDQNYPNPFNPRTVIPFSLPRAGRVTLAVYDVLGRRVATLVDSVMPAGFYAVPFDAARQPSGVYLFRLVSGSEIRSRSMVIVK